MAKRRLSSWNKIEVKATLLYEDKHKEGGVYQILHKENGRKYIGSTVEFEGRWRGHIRDLRGGTHCNKFLQNDFNKSGEDKFEFSIVEIVVGALQARRDREQFYLDRLWEESALDTDKRYNHVRTAVLAEPRKLKSNTAINWHWFLSPDGKEYVVETLPAFCKTFKLSLSEMTKLVSKEILEYEGWSLREKKAIFKTIVNEDTLQEIDCSSCFIADKARDLGVQQSHLSKLLNGKRKSVGPWSVKNRIYISRPNKGKVCWLLSPENGVVKVNNIKLFAKERGLSPYALRKVALGKQLEHNGWIRYLKHEDSREVVKTATEAWKRKKYDKQAKHYRLVSPDGVITDIFNMARFCRENALCKQSMLALHKGEGMSAYGWTRAT